MSDQSRDRLVFARGRPERNGWLLGLTIPQLVLCVGSCVPLLLMFGAGVRAQAVELTPAAMLVVVLGVVPVRGRPAARWLADTSLHALARRAGWSRFQSLAAAGLPSQRAVPDVPGGLGRLRPVEGPIMPEHGRVCVLHDPAEGRWAATASLSARGIGLASAHECAGMADGLRQLLRGLVDVGRIDRLTLLVRSVPDDGTAYQLWRDRHAVADPPDLSRAAHRELRAATGSAAVRQESFVTVSASDDALRRQARDAGGGPDGYAYALYRGLVGLTEPLQAMGCDAPQWLGPDGVAEAIRTGFNPGAAAVLARRRLSLGRRNPETGERVAEPLPWNLAGPSHAPSTSARSYTHDGYTTVSYTAVPTGAEIHFGALAPLLAVRRAGERRCVAVHFEVVPQRIAARMVGRERQATTLLGDVKSARGFTRSASDARAGRAAHRSEDAVAAGEGLVRTSVTASVTVPAHWNVEDHAEALETSAPGQFHLQRLELAQDSGFVAAAIPVGIGLARLRSQW